MIQAIIFDLDSCLCAANEVGDHLFEPAFEAIRKANQGRLSEDELKAAFADCWRYALDQVAARHGFSDEMLAAGWNVLARTEVREPMRGYPDLAVLPELPARKFLVTSGFRRLQESKIEALGIAPWFDGISIDALDDGAARKGKQRIFEDILAAERLSPREALVVGDNPDSEIAAGNRLGITTVQILRPGVPASNEASRSIHRLDELKGILAAAGNGPG